MKQKAFENQYADLWQRFDQLLEKPMGHSGKNIDRAQSLPILYRQICHHYALARQRQYSPHLINQLHVQVLKGHRYLYRKKHSWAWPLLEFIWIQFPQQVRRHANYVWLAIALFYLPAVAMGLACYFDDEMIYHVMNSENVSNMEYMYDPDNEKVGRSAEREADTNVYMFGYYINNNISIGFQMFAMGILAGIGTVLSILYNGVVIGGVAGHLSQLGFNDTFWPFVSGHGSYELTAICISAAAGLRLAKPLLAPGPYSRGDAFKLAGRDSIQLALGAGLMLLVAAFIEAFWSPLPGIASSIKYIVAAFLWLSVILYLCLAGRERRI